MQLSFQRVVPVSVQNLDLSDLERIFALGRGYQGEKGDARALPMKQMVQHQLPHYIVPKFEKDTQVNWQVTRSDEFQEAKELD